MRRVICGDLGQMTVELAVAMPVLIIVAVVAVNALQFLATCASFDRSAHDAARIFAASPAYGQDVDQSCSLIEQRLQDSYGKEENMDVSVSAGAAGIDFEEYVATLRYHPTLFGMGLRSEVFGVALPPLTHSTRFVVDGYKPGVVI